MRKVLLMLMALILLAGCSEVQLSPRYQQVLEMSVINVRAMLIDCQGGNQQSCEKGLELAANLLDHMVDASYGRVSDGEDK